MNYVIDTYNRFGIFAQNMFHGVQSSDDTLIARDFSLFHWHVEINAEIMQKIIRNHQSHSLSFIHFPLKLCVNTCITIQYFIAYCAKVT